MSRGGILFSLCVHRLITIFSRFRGFSFTITLREKSKGVIRMPHWGVGADNPVYPPRHAPPKPPPQRRDYARQRSNPPKLNVWIRQREQQARNSFGPQGYWERKTLNLKKTTSSVLSVLLLMFS